MAHLAYLKSDNNINGEKAALFFFTKQHSQFKNKYKIEYSY